MITVQSILLFLGWINHSMNGFLSLRLSTTSLVALQSPIQHKHKDLVSKVLSYLFLYKAIKSRWGFYFLSQNQTFPSQFNDSSKTRKHSKRSNPYFWPFQYDGSNIQQVLLGNGIILHTWDQLRSITLHLIQLNIWMKIKKAHNLSHSRR